MVSFFSMVWSSVGKKIMTGLTGVGLCLFIIGHLAGNFSLLVSAEAFNLYTYKLFSLGGLLYVIEALLTLAFVLHAIVGISIYLKKRKARPIDYIKVANAGGNSHKSISSVSMIWTGLILLVFLVLHLKTFKFGPYYETSINGIIMRDLYRLVIEVYQQPSYVISYTVIMILLGVHLRHGFWSAFQSLGVNHPRYSPVIYGFGIFFALVMAAGFILIPIWIYFTKQ
ncbi:succinate dehydrogenase cytochrome b subunit [bacterium]|nr:succinate dehydrogenase cytochrome b subunit [bacterium]